MRGLVNKEMTSLKFLLMIVAVMIGMTIDNVLAREIDPDCIPTRSDSLGPFFIANTPVVANLNRFGKPGEAMRIVGKVLSATPPYSPIANARIEIWQTDGNGRYYPQDNGDYSDYDDGEIDLRGTVLTNGEGQFSVLSLFPYRYRPRPPHIHYRISASGYQTLITQHYLDVSNRDRCRTTRVNRAQQPARFDAPVIYLQQLAPNA